MSIPDDSECKQERAALLAQIAELDAEIKRRVIALISHPETPAFFKEHPIVTEFES